MEGEVTDNQCPVCYLDYTDTIDTPETHKVVVCPAWHRLCKTCYISITRNDNQKKCPMCRVTMFDWNYSSSQQRTRQPRRRHRCGECRQEGHNRTTCPHLAHVREYDRQRELQRQDQLHSNIYVFSVLFIVGWAIYLDFMQCIMFLRVLLSLLFVLRLYILYTQ
jgi:hypothetical protein